MGVAKRDSIVPAHFGVTLYEALADPKRLAVIVSADHNNWVDYIDATWWQVATSFLLDGAAPP